MITNFDKVPETIDALKFYIHAGNNSIKSMKVKINKLQELVNEAKRRLITKENSIAENHAGAA